MLWTARRLNTRLDMLALSKEVRSQILLWHHPNFRKKKLKHYRTKICWCLKNKDRVETVGDTVWVAEHLNSAAHQERKNCKCRACSEDWNVRKCGNPYKCTKIAKSLLDNLVEKWEPHRHEQNDGLSLTLEENTQNLDAKENNTLICFDPTIDSELPLIDGIWIFTPDWNVYTKVMARYQGLREGEEQLASTSMAYTDGSACDNGTAGARAGAGVWYSKGDERNVAIHLPGPHQMNNTAEIHAVLKQVLAAAWDETIITISDLKYVIKGLCFNLQQWEDSGWVRILNSELWKVTA